MPHEVPPEEAEQFARAIGPPRDAVPDPPPPDRADGTAAGGPTPARADGGDATSDGANDGAEATFAAVRRRVERAEALAAAEDLPALTDAVAAAGGLEGVRDLRAELDGDLERLRETERRARALRERVTAVDVPVERLERLA